MHSDFRFALLRDQYKGSNYWAVRSISSRFSRYINLKLTFSIVFVSILMFTFSNFQFVPNCQKLWHLKNHLFLLLHTAWSALASPLSLLPLTCDTHVVFLQWNVSQCVQIWIFNISNTDSFTQTICLWYKYYPKWICISFSFQYIYTCIICVAEIWLTGCKTTNKQPYSIPALFPFVHPTYWDDFKNFVHFHQAWYTRYAWRLVHPSFFFQEHKLKVIAIYKSHVGYEFFALCYSFFNVIFFIKHQ